MKLILFALMGILVGFVTPAFAENSLLLTVNSYSEFRVGEGAVVFGNTTDYDGNPISDTEIQVGFPSRTIITTTNENGQFNVQSPPLETPGKYTIYVTATKGILHTDTQLPFRVTEKNPSTYQYDSNENKTNKGPKLDLLGMMNEKMEEQKQITENLDKIQEQNESLKGQRQIVKDDLVKDMESFEKKHEVNSPRNAFLRFLSGIDSVVKNLFWNQFLFTEEITDEARQAKQKALEEGKTSLEATKVFQEEAAVSQKEIIELNKNLNIQYGNATNSSQSQFNEYGKIERER